MGKSKTAWHKVRLDDGEGLSLIIDHRGITPKKLGGDWDHSGIPALSAKNIKNGQIINQSDIRYINQNMYEKWMPEKLEKGDILLTSEAPLGEVYYLKEKNDYCLSQRLFALRANIHVLYPCYLYHFLRSPSGQHALERRISGTAAQGIRQAELRKIDVVVPVDISEQKRIAEILSAFDDKIENNNRIIKMLEEMAQAIFKEWFVNFRFPGYEKVKMVDSELGKIPEGWEVRSLNSIVELDKGLSYKGSGLAEKGMPMINLGCFLRGGKFLYDNLKHYVGDYKPRHISQVGDLLVSNTDITQDREIIGNPVIVEEWLGNRKYLFTHHIYIIRPKYKLNKIFFYYLLRQTAFRARVIGAASGTNILGLSKESISSFEIIVPPVKLVEKFTDIPSQILEKISKIQTENQKLAKLRDLLLPKLMSGEVGV
jgi:type I restriction enzyme S subunit